MGPFFSSSELISFWTVPDSRVQTEIGRVYFHTGEEGKCESFSSSSKSSETITSYGRRDNKTAKRSCKYFWSLQVPQFSSPWLLEPGGQLEIWIFSYTPRSWSKLSRKYQLAGVAVKLCSFDIRAAQCGNDDIIMSWLKQHNSSRIHIRRIYGDIFRRENLFKGLKCDEN